ncbi:MAG: pectinesterase family protein, partial [Spirosomataceae bacterium]
MEKIAKIIAFLGLTVLVAMACKQELDTDVAAAYEEATYNVTVAKDGTGNFTTVQAAVNAAPTGRTSVYRIYIKNGTYTEVVTVPSNKPFLQFVGQTRDGVIITFNNYNGKTNPAGGTFGTSNSATVTINANDFSAANV